MKQNNSVEFINITKEFGEIKALENASFSIKKGSIHAIIGENGAGKSTLMSILFGLYSPTKGKIKINGIQRNIKNSNYANDLGIGMVHQHFKIVDIFSNIENIILGNEPNKNLVTNKKEAAKKLKSIQEKFNFKFDLNNKSGKESVGVQQKVEIMKMLYRDSEILVFDEPTAVLTPQEIKGFLQTLRDFKAAGKTVIFISHKLNEIKEVADEATIIRKGKVVKTINVKTSTIKKMAEMMVGKNVVFSKNKHSKIDGENYLVLKNLNANIGDKKIKDLSLEVKSGEIYAIAGIEGNGQMVLEEVVSGIKKQKSGEILMINKNADKLVKMSHSSVKKRIDEGMSYIPGDRHKYAMVLDYKISDTMIQRQLHKKQFSLFTYIKNAEKYKFYKKIQNKFDIRGGRSGDAISRGLSGGNQQKAVVGREMSSNHNVLVVVQPTRGLDVGAIKNIHEKILEEKSKGKAILLISFELDEVLSLADKIGVLSEGKIIGELNGKNASRNEIGLMMAGIVKGGGKNEKN